MARSNTKTSRMGDIFASQLASANMKDIKADRGRAFRGAVMQEFMDSTTSTKGCATVMYNRIKRSLIDSGTLSGSLLGRSAGKKVAAKATPKTSATPKASKGPQRDANGRFIKRS